MEGSSNGNGVASLYDTDSGDADSNENLSGDEYSNLDLSFDDVGEINGGDDDDEGRDEPGFFQKSHTKGDAGGEDPLGKKPQGSDPSALSEYILGTLVVRVVAARDLEPANGGGFGKMLFGGGSSRGQNGGAANPYASVRFGMTTQRTSEVFDALDPIWPRGETMYMDVTHSALPDDLTPTTEYEPDSFPAAPAGAYRSKAGQTSKSVPTVTVTKAAAKEKATTPKKGRALADSSEPWEPVLTVALFHASEMGVNKYPDKKGGLFSGDSDDKFLGMTAVNLTQLLTGKVRTFDEWLPLAGSESSRSSVRIVCEYEASDSTPRPGDYVRFTNFCHPADLYPLQTNRRYRVEESNGDQVVVSYASPEGWLSSFMVHRFMLVCEQRHQAAIEIYQEELSSIKDRLAYSPMVSAVANSVTRVPDEGLVTVANDAIIGGVSLLTRWLQGGAKTVVSDVATATNWDGRFNPDLGTSLSTGSMDDAEESQDATPKASPTKDDAGSSSNQDDEVEPLPNMPSCPITGTNVMSLSKLYKEDRLQYFPLSHLCSPSFNYRRTNARPSRCGRWSHLRAFCDCPLAPNQ